MLAGATLWLLACLVPAFVMSAAARMALSSLIVASYTFLTAAELWRERRKTLLRRWPAVFVPILHGIVFLAPIPLASFLPDDRGLMALASGWIAVFALEMMLYVVGTAFIVLVLAKERSVRIQRDAASTDELTGLLNRRGFFAAAQLLVQRQARKGEPVSILMLDLDHFKSINDRFGHAIGDETLRLFGATAAGNLRATDVVARFGGEEFIAMLPGSLADAAAAAERLRSAFAAAAAVVGGHPLAATVSIGAASAALCADVPALIASADRALYRAKQNGRNRVEGVGQAPPLGGAVRAPSGAEEVLAWEVEGRTARA
jgi:diguanylate cyclase (GGDEF)-like protein